MSTDGLRGAVASALSQLQGAEDQPTFLGIFGYTSGAAYGVLLDLMTPGWTEHVTAETDLGELLFEAASLEEQAGEPDLAESAAQRYAGTNLRIVEERREAERGRKSRGASCAFC